MFGWKQEILKTGTGSLHVYQYGNQLEKIGTGRRSVQERGKKDNEGGCMETLSEDKK